ncbi:MAG: antitoxin component YwqK of YwqJK toxin-antitoxin module, partial [Bacteroidia bacterium]
PSGELHYEWMYKNNLLEGETKEFDIEGNLLNTWYYSNNELSPSRN